MNILGVFLFNKIRTGGDRRYLELMEALALRGNNVLVIMNNCLDYKARYIKQVFLSIKYTYRGFPPASWLFREHIKKELSLIKQAALENGLQKIDFLHIHGDTNLKAARFLKKKLQIPLFYASRNNDVERDRIIRKSGGLSLKQYLFSILYEQINLSRERQIAKYADLITFQSYGDMGDFVKRTYCADDKIVIIPGNIGPPRFADEYKNKNNVQNVNELIYVGSIAPNKGLREFILVVKKLYEKGFQGLKCRLLMRNEHIEKYTNLLNNYGLNGMFIFEGFKAPFPYLADAGLMVYPVSYDAFPDAVLEALHTGCPVIASRVGGLPDMLRYPELLFEAGNIAEIADKIERCIQDRDFYRHIRSLCAERADAYRFDWAGQFENAMKAYLHRE